MKYFEMVEILENEYDFKHVSYYTDKYCYYFISDKYDLSFVCGDTAARGSICYVLKKGEEILIYEETSAWERDIDSSKIFNKILNNVKKVVLKHRINTIIKQIYE